MKTYLRLLLPKCRWETAANTLSVNTDTLLARICPLRCIEMVMDSLGVKS